MLPIVLFIFYKYYSQEFKTYIYYNIIIDYYTTYTFLMKYESIFTVLQYLQKDVKYSFLA